MLETVRTTSFWYTMPVKQMCVGPTANQILVKGFLLMNTFNIAESLLVPVMNK